MPKDNSISTNITMTMNPLMHTSNKAITRDKIRCIIKNVNGDQLLFKNKNENWECITTKRLDRCELKYLIKECIKQVFPSIRIDTTQLSLQSVKTHEFHVHEYIFELKNAVPNDVEVKIPKSSSYTEFKWLSKNPVIQNKLKSKRIENITENIINVKNENKIETEIKV